MVAGLVILVALFIGLSGHSLPGDGISGEIHCGSAFAPDHTDAIGTDLGAGAAGFSRDFDSQCADALSTPRTIGLSLLGVSLLALLFMGLTVKPLPAPAPQREVEHDAT